MLKFKKDTKKPVAKVKTKKVKSTAQKIKFENFKDVQETIVIRQGNYLKAKGDKKLSGFYLQYPNLIKDQIVQVVKTAKFEKPVMIKLGHSESAVFIPKQNTKKVKYENNKKGLVLKAIKSSFKYASVVFIKNNGLVETKKIVEVEGKKAKTYKAK